MREILVISSDGELTKHLKLRLEGSGFVVSTSESLEKSFLEAGLCEPFLVIVDSESIQDNPWQAANFLKWLHHRSPVILLSDERCEELQAACDDCLPRMVASDELLSRIRGLSVH